jgi:hypothetical protein
MKKCINIFMILSLSINLVMYLIEFYKFILYYDSYVFTETDSYNYRIAFLNIILSLLILILLIKKHNKRIILSIVFSCIWLNNFIMLRIETFETIFFMRYIYIGKLIFTFFSVICFVISIIIFLIYIINYFQNNKVNEKLSK